MTKTSELFRYTYGVSKFPLKEEGEPPKDVKLIGKAYHWKQIFQIIDKISPETKTKKRKLWYWKSGEQEWLAVSEETKPKDDEGL